MRNKYNLLFPMIITGFLFGETIDTRLNIYENNSHVSMTERVDTNEKKSKNYNITAGMLVDSIFVDSKNMKINEISINKNTINLKKLLNDRLGKKIRFFHTEEEKTQKTIIEGELISINPLIIKDFGDKIYTFVDQKDIIVEEIPSNYSVRPSLDISYTYGKVKSKSLEYELNYMTSGMSCEAIYNLFISDDGLSIKGLLKVENNTNMDFQNANVVCVSGNFNTKKPNRIMSKSYAMQDSLNEHNSYDTVKSEEYNVYALPKKINLNRGVEKMHQFIDKKGLKVIEVNKIALSQNGYNPNPINQRFNRYLYVENAKDSGLYMNLPKGTLRVYKEMANGYIYHGGSDVKYTPKGETVEILLGQNNEITLEEQYEKFLATDKTENINGEKVTYKETLVEKEITVKNNGKKVKKFNLVQEMTNGVELKTISNSCVTDHGICKIVEKHGEFIIDGVLSKEAKVKLKYKIISNKRITKYRR